jgi:hypothetical protein
LRFVVETKSLTRPVHADRDMTPEQERHYRPALAAIDRAFEKAGADDPGVVVDAVTKALFRNRSNPRIVVGRGTGTLMLLGGRAMVHARSAEIN